MPYCSRHSALSHVSPTTIPGRKWVPFYQRWLSLPEVTQPEEHQPCVYFTRCTLYVDDLPPESQTPEGTPEATWGTGNPQVHSVAIVDKSDNMPCLSFQGLLPIKYTFRKVSLNLLYLCATLHLLKQQILKVQATSIWGPLNCLTCSPPTTTTEEPPVLSISFLLCFWEGWTSQCSQSVTWTPECGWKPLHKATTPAASANRSHSISHRVILTCTYMHSCTQVHQKDRAWDDQKWKT